MTVKLEWLKTGKWVNRIWVPNVPKEPRSCPCNNPANPHYEKDGVIVKLESYVRSEDRS